MEIVAHQLLSALLFTLVGATGLTAIVMLLDRRAIGPGGHYLIGFLALICAIASSDAVRLSGIYAAEPWLEAIVGPLLRAATLLLGPMIYLFITHNVMDDTPMAPVGIHAIPAAIAAAAFAFVNGPDEWRSALFGSATAAQAYAQGAIKVFWAGFIGLGALYLYRCFRAIQSHSESLYQFLSEIPGSTDSRLRLLWALVMLPVASIAAEFIANRLTVLPEAVKFAAGIFRIACLIAICAFAL